MSLDTTLDPKAAPPALKPGDRVICTVAKVFPFGVFVRIGQIEGYIRRRELTLSGNANPAETVDIGQSLEAIVLEPASPGKSVLLSAKAALEDPWPRFVRQHREDDPVLVTVKAIYANSVRVEVVPGVDGDIPLAELTAGRRIRKPEDVLWERDRTEALITHIDHTNRRLHLSIRRLLERMATTDKILGSLGDSPARASVSSIELAGVEAQHARIALPGPLLVVEDHDNLRLPLVDTLAEFGCEVIAVQSARQALEACEHHGFAFALVDLDLPEMPGVALIRELRERRNSMPIAVMSGPDMIQQHLAELRDLEIVATFPKPLDEEAIYHVLMQVAEGDTPHLPDDPADQPTSAQILDFQDTVALIQSASTFVDKMQKGLDRVTADVQADLGVIFHLHPTSKTLSIVVQSGHPHFDPQACYKLKESPVKDVIVEQRRVWEGRASAEPSKRFRNLLAVLEFQSCIGIPLEASGSTQHSLFLFSRQADAFSLHRLRDVLAVAVLFSAALERYAFEDRLQAAGRVIVSGHLASAFGHEVYNKVSGLGLQIGNVRKDLEMILAPGAQLIRREDLLLVRDELAQAAQFIADLTQVVQQYQRIMRASPEQTFAIQQVVQAAQAQVTPLALRARVQITTEIAPDLPLAYGNPILMQQVFLNLLLNAVQHMSATTAGRRNVTVSATILESAVAPQVEIRFADTGPGIHARLWDKVFEIGYTTREDGSGLGLTIARSIVQRFGGSIAIEDSVVQFGTTFLVQLPVVS